PGPHTSRGSPEGPLSRGAVRADTQGTQAPRTKEDRTMPTFDDHATVEYRELMSQGRNVERTGQMCWMAGAVSGAMMMSWAVAARSPALMIPVVFAMAAGFYAMLRARQHARWIECYIEEFHETTGGSQWFTRAHRLQSQYGHPVFADWLPTIMACMGTMLTV